jgi:GMP synthase-like glutamine amidotransferase
VICYVDIEHERILQDPRKRPDLLVRRMEVKLRLEEISGQACLLQRYPRVTRQRLKEWNIRALIISGCGADWSEYSEADLAEMYRIIRAADLPILGLCGGHQLIAMAYGAPLGTMRRLEEGEEDVYPGLGPGYLKEWGYTPVRVVKADPIFEGLGEEPMLLEAHYWEVKEVPPGFELLASTDVCRIQAIKQTGQLVYGTQFHPEYYYLSEEEKLRYDGRELLANFFKLTGILG